MISDVPLGAFLSGGVDSSTVVALMQAQSDKPIKTFSIGFNVPGFNEAEHARKVAEHLGTHHTELYVTAEMALDVIPKLPSLYDEPFADSSQIPTFLVAQMARQYVTVALSGDGGDELFCGYNRYLATSQIWSKLKYCPQGLRKLIAYGLKTVPETGWDGFFKWLPMGKDWAHIGQKLHKAANVMSANSLYELHRGLVSQWQNPEQVVINGVEPAANDCDMSDLSLNDIELMMAFDTLNYLTDDILVKTDRAAMGVSLEGRTPLLDHEVFTFAWSLPIDYKLKDKVTKWPLRAVLYRYVPKDLIERPKAGFTVPLDHWLRGSLKEWATDLLDREKMASQGFLHVDIVHQKWNEHLSGKRNWASQLWIILMFQAWLKEQNCVY